jgi:hypothetical protein
MSFSGVSLVASVPQVVYPEMHVPELGVPALPSDQVVVSAIFHNLAAFIKDNDSIGVPDGRETMAASCRREHDILANALAINRSVSGVEQIYAMMIAVPPGNSFEMLRLISDSV